MINNTLYYEIRYRYYQHNTGAADNGYYIEKIKCNLGEIDDIYAKLTKLVGYKSWASIKTKELDELADEITGHLSPGYVDRIIGIYKITEELINVRDFKRVIETKI